MAAATLPAMAATEPPLAYPPTTEPPATYPPTTEPPATESPTPPPPTTEPPEEEPELPVTGTPGLALASSGLLLLGLGTTAWLIARRRRVGV